MTQRFPASVQNEALYFTDPTVGGVMNDGTDQSAAMTTFVTKVNQAGNGAGIIPSGVIHVTPPATPWTLGGAAAATSGRIEGQGGGGIPGGGATTILGLTDSNNTPFTQPWFLVGGGNSGDWALSKVSLNAHQRFGPGSGIIPSGSPAIWVAGNGKVADCDANNFAAGLVLGGDHIDIRRIGGSGNGVGIYTPPNLNTQGDITLDTVQLSGKLAVWALASSSKLGGVVGRRVTGANGPLYFWRFNDGGTASQLAIGYMRLENCGIEVMWHGLYFDELYGTATAGDINALTLDPPPQANGNLTYSTTVDGNTWAATVTTGNLSVSGSQLTVTVPAGFYVRPGMVVVDPSAKIAAGTTVSSIISGAWPGTGYTLQLSTTPSGTPTSTITIRMPQVAVVACDAYNGVKYKGGYLYGGDTTGLPVHLVNRFINCSGDTDIAGAVTAAAGGQPYVSLNTGLFSKVTQGCAFGSPPGGGSQRMILAQATASVAQWDIVMMDTSNAVNGLACKPADGTRKVLGVALRAVSSGQSVEILATSLGTTVNNKSASNILANALIKVDAANPGGVTTAASMTDGPAIGQGGPITAGATGGATIWS